MPEVVTLTVIGASTLVGCRCSALARSPKWSGSLNAKPQQVLVDQGFRGKEHHPDAIEVLVCGGRKQPSSFKRLLKRRSAIEPAIGHGKADHALGCNSWQVGDRLNALLIGCGFNCHDRLLEPENCDRSCFKRVLGLGADQKSACKMALPR